MIVAGEASGDIWAADLVRGLRQEFAEAKPIPTTDLQPLQTSLEPRFFGAGGPRMAAAGVELAFDLTAHSLIGLSGVLRGYFKFRKLFHQLYQLALERQPDFIICVDFSGFNRRFAHAIKQHVRSRHGWFQDWNPKIIQYVSPQVWASRASRARQMERDYDLLLSIFPFEKDWYAHHAPNLRVIFVGNPIVDRYPNAEGSDGFINNSAFRTPHLSRRSLTEADSALSTPHSALRTPHSALRTPHSALVLLLPGSRVAELARHLPVMLGALAIMRTHMPTLRARIIVPSETLVDQATRLGVPSDVPIQAAGLP